MVISRSREWDRKILGHYLEIYATCVEKEFMDLSAHYAKQIDRVKNRIATHDYKDEDAEQARLDEIDKRFISFAEQT